MTNPLPYGFIHFTQIIGPYLKLLIFLFRMLPWNFLSNLVLPLLEHFWTPSTKMIMIFIFFDSFKNLCTNPCWNNLWMSLHCFRSLSGNPWDPHKTILCDSFFRSKNWKIQTNLRVTHVYIQLKWNSFKRFHLYWFLYVVYSSAYLALSYGQFLGTEY